MSLTGDFSLNLIGMQIYSIFHWKQQKTNLFFYKSQYHSIYLSIKQQIISIQSNTLVISGYFVTFVALNTETTSLLC